MPCYKFRGSLAPSLIKVGHFGDTGGLLTLKPVLFGALVATSGLLGLQRSNIRNDVSYTQGADGLAFGAQVREECSPNWHLLRSMWCLVHAL